MTEPRRGAYGKGRLTRQRVIIAGVADAMSGAFSVDDLVAEVRKTDPKASTATIYRAVSAMEASSHIQRVGQRDGRALYARCGDATHHHHIVCDRCGRVAHTDCPVDGSLAASDGFVITRHEVTLYGLCPECMTAGSET